MRIRVLGGGLYGCHLTAALLDAGHDVELHEIAGELFSGASGNIPARLHCGAHYPRSKLTRDACQNHFAEFMAVYGDFTRGIPCNVYAIAHDSHLDFGTYHQLMKAEIPCIPVYRPADLGLQNVEGAILTGERHILVDQLRKHFTARLGSAVRFGMPFVASDDGDWDATIDATFCARDSLNVDRYEVCLTVLLRGSVDRAITIMDGPFPSLYPWDEENGLCSLTSAKLTPLHTDSDRERAALVRTKLSESWASNRWNRTQVNIACHDMINQMAEYYPSVWDFEIHDARIAIRAMPRSNSDARLIDVAQIGERVLRIRAGKLDAVFAAEQQIKEYLDAWR